MFLINDQVGRSVGMDMKMNELNSVALVELF